MMRISILGIGWFGEQLAEEVSSQYTVLGSTRSTEKKDKFSNLGYEVEELIVPQIPSHRLLEADIILLNFPPFKDQLSWWKNWPIKKTSHLIMISSTSVYGANHGEVSESTKPIPNTENGETLLAEEEWVRNNFPRHTIIRFGGLIGPNRHPGRYLSGRKNISGGKSPVNLIHSGDCVGFLKTVLSQSLYGTFNLVFPDHPERKNYYTEFCMKEKLSLPEFLDEKAEDKIVTDSRINMFYKFAYPIR